MIGQKLKVLRTKNHYTVAQLCQQLNMSVNTYNNYERETRDVSTDVLMKFAEFYGVSADYLLGRADPPPDPFMELPAEDQEKEIIKAYLSLDISTRRSVMAALESAFANIRRQPEAAEEIIAETREIIHTILVEYYPDAVSAGIGVILGDERPEKLPFEATESARKADFAVTVHGDSMTPTFTDGDIVFVRKDSVDIGEIGVFRQNGEGFIKECGDKELISHNPTYPPIPMLPDCFAVGKVIGKGNPIPPEPTE